VTTLKSAGGVTSCAVRRRSAKYLISREATATARRRSAASSIRCRRYMLCDFPSPHWSARPVPVRSPYSDAPRPADPVDRPHSSRWRPSRWAVYEW
jgi:hypothetical protein